MSDGPKCGSHAYNITLGYNYEFARNGFEKKSYLVKNTILGIYLEHNFD